MSFKMAIALAVCFIRFSEEKPHRASIVPFYMFCPIFLRPICGSLEKRKVRGHVRTPSFFRAGRSPASITGETGQSKSREGKAHQIAKQTILEYNRTAHHAWHLVKGNLHANTRRKIAIVEYNLQQFKTETIKACGEMAMELIMIKGLTEDTVKRLMTMRQDISELKTTLGEHTKVLSEHTIRFDRLETLLTQILARLPEKP